MRTLLLSTFVLLALGFAPAPFPRSGREVDPDKADLARLQGVWQEVRYREGSDDRPGDGTLVLVAGSRMTYRLRDEIRSDWTITLDARARPRGMRHRYFSGKGGPHESIYLLEGDNLTLCYSVAGRYHVRPDDFTPDRGRAVVTLRRVR